ncbi:hypothetical protein F5Y16DRAFT_177472 [Xylariaceae sp. FL0255]|nr:hypothetical protein F5Y16DRAFT_177472 [Xylariaceae sp. FL0255]
MVFDVTQPSPPSAEASGSVVGLFSADHTWEYRVRDLSTRSVTLFPSRAQIVRDIKNIPLKNGTNQIAIIGLTPTLDEHSVKVEGTGSAVITDLTVELVPNREIFDEIYPDDSDDDKSDDLASDYDDDEEDPELKAVKDDIRQLTIEQEIAHEKRHSAESRLQILDAFGVSMATDREVDIDISVGIEAYRSEREKTFRDHLEGRSQEQEIATKLISLVKKQSRLKKQLAKASAKALAAKTKEKDKQRRKALEQKKEARRLRKERESFWPKKVYIVKVTLEVNNFTPSTSRRSSIVSEISKPTVEKEGQGTINACDLSLSYVTTYAFWSPAYDLALSTTNSSGVLCFDARLTNQTSETWDNCKIVLSTSQTETSSLGDSIPSLTPWRVRLVGKGHFSLSDDILYARDEMSQANMVKQQNNRLAQRPRWELFGVDVEPPWGARQMVNYQQPSQQPYRHPFQKSSAFAHNNNNTHSLFGAANPMSANVAPPVPPPPAEASGLFGNAPDNRGGGGFGGANTNTSAGGLFGAASTTTNTAPVPSTVDEVGASRTAPFDDFSNQRLDDQATLAEPQPDVDFEESTFEENGLTTTYDLPGLKSLPPSSNTSKQRVVRIAYSNVLFQHIVVAKHRRAAFLKTKVRNNSKLTLLKGHTSLTLDGTFLGRIPLPRSSPGETFSLNLGIDPIIKVIYPKPEVKRSSSGLFTKENCSVYSRMLTLIDTRTGTHSKAAHITVLDQIPVSEDERLKIELLKPSGLVCDGSAVKAGNHAQQTSSMNQNAWGRAEAQLKNAGEVSWDITLNPGGHAEFDLEYQCVTPSGDQAVNSETHGFGQGGKKDAEMYGVGFGGKKGT